MSKVTEFNCGPFKDNLIGPKNNQKHLYCTYKKMQY